MVEGGPQEEILRIFSGGVNAVKTHEEILNLADKELDESTLEVST